MVVLYTAVLSRRIPILPAFSGQLGHLGHESPDVAVGDIFDLNRLSAVLDDSPIVQFHELKLADRTPDRLKTVVFDGEHPQVSADGKALSVGERIAALPPMRDVIGVWSVSQATGARFVSAPSLGDSGTSPSPLLHLVS